MNKKRRNFIKYSLITLGLLPFLKFFGAGWLSNKSSRAKSIDSNRKEVDLPSGRGFRILESEDEIEFYNKHGKKVLGITKDGGIKVG